MRNQCATGPTVFPPGSRIGKRYEVLREVGRRAYSTVYAAQEHRTGQVVALKVLTPPPNIAPMARERLRREAALTKRIQHPGIVPVRAYLEENGISIVVLEYVPGQDLAERIRARGPLGTVEVVHLGIELASALGAAHAVGIVHRDLAPEHILIDQVMGPRITDFGFARHDEKGAVTDQGDVVGTLVYSAPELLAGERGDARSDVYSLGLTLYTTLIGELPQRFASRLPPPPVPEGFHPRRSAGGSHVPAWLDDAIARATAADPADRYRTMEDLAHALRLHQVEAPAEDRAPKRGPDDCLVCGEPSCLGLPICDTCGALGERNADTLLLVSNGTRRAGDPHPLHSAGDLTGHRVAPALLRKALHGQRTLAQIPSLSSPRVLDHLKRFGLQGRLVPVTHAWQALPLSMGAVLLAVVLSGIVAGLVADQRFLWATPLVATLLAWSAIRALRTPLLRPRRLDHPLDPAIEAVAAGALLRLAPGPAQRLLADILRLARRAVAEDDAPLEHIYALVTSSSEAAQDLEVLDDNLDRFDRQRREMPALPPDWWESATGTETTRDRLAQQLLEAAAVLSRYQSFSVETLSGAAANLEAALTEAKVALA